MKKRGRHTLYTKALTKRLCAWLRDGNTIVTACHAEGLGERTYYDFCERYPAFAAATRKARAQAKIHLVSIIRKAAIKNPFHAQWLLERSWPNEYARTERVEQIGEKAEERKGGCHIYYDTGKHTLAELLDFPTMDDPPEVAAEKQRRLLEMTPAKNASVSA
jgi:hypothetical protein